MGYSYVIYISKVNFCLYGESAEHYFNIKLSQIFLQGPVYVPRRIMCGILSLYLCVRSVSYDPDVRCWKETTHRFNLTSAGSVLPFTHATHLLIYRQHHEACRNRCPAPPTFCCAVSLFTRQHAIDLSLQSLSPPHQKRSWKQICFLQLCNGFHMGVLGSKSTAKRVYKPLRCTCSGFQKFNSGNKWGSWDNDRAFVS